MSQPPRRDDVARTQRRDLIILWAYFIVWTSIALGFFYIFAIRASSLFGGLISGSMVLLGLFWIWGMARATANEAKFGVVSLTPAKRPACPGDRLEALLRFHDKTPGFSEIDAELRCVAVTIIRRSQTGIAPLEEIAWSTRKTFPLRHDQAAIGFDIPADAPVTDLPGERQGESGWHSLPMEPGKALRFHRWELFVTARAPGIDLERGFPVVIDPREKSTAAGLKKAMPNSVPIPRGPGTIPSILIGMVMVGFFFFNFVSGTISSEERAKQIAAAPPLATRKPPVQVRELLPQTPWTRDTQGWDLPMPAFSRAIGIAARGIRSTREKDSERIVFDEILIEMNPAWSHMDYFDVMVTVTYFPADLRPTVTLGGISTRLDDVRGSLTADVPAHALRDLSVTVPLPKGEIGRTEVTLGINAHINDPSSRSRYTHETSRKLVLETK